MDRETIQQNRDKIMAALGIYVTLYGVLNMFISPDPVWLRVVYLVGMASLGLPSALELEWKSHPDRYPDEIVENPYSLTIPMVSVGFGCVFMYFLFALAM